MLLEHVDRDSFIFPTIAVGFVALMLGTMPVLMWHLYIKPTTESMGITYAMAPNYWNAWGTMWIGNLIAFAPACATYWPAYFSTTAVHWYELAWKWAKQVGDAVGLLTIVFLVIEAISTGKGQTATKSIWISMVLYVVTNMVAASIWMKAAPSSYIWYMYPVWKAMSMKEENNSDFADTATELLATF